MSRYVNEQEQEHWDHVAGSASEFQNCFEEARIAASREANKHGAAIGDVLATGRFAVVLRCPYYCKATDAIAGSVEYLRGDYASRAEANAEALRIYSSEGLDSFEDLYVLPRVPLAVVLELPPVADDDVPF